jgi:hypothetical protein
LKFEKKHPSAGSTDRYEFEYSFVTKSVKLGQCRWCSSFTKWMDVLFCHHACSEECLGAMWRSYRDDQKKKSTYENFENHFDQVKQELKLAEEAKSVSKDIVIVVRDQLDYLKQCIDSVRQNTRNYHLFIWDNGSAEQTKNYIEQLSSSRDPNDCLDGTVTTMRSEVNTGFIKPNNEMASWGEGEYLILLNSDTKVFPKWSDLMTGFLDSNPDVAEVGYWGGHMGPDGRGFGGGNGYDVDYIPGWCLCISRKDYRNFGLFDDANLDFAYCEDADLSLRIKEAGKKIYSLHAPLVHHYQNKTIIEVEREGQIDVKATFERNHCYLEKRWANYLAKERVVLKRKDSDVQFSGTV